MGARRSSPAGATRRHVLRLLGWSVGSLLVGCGTGGGLDPQKVAEQARGYDPSLECTDTSGLWPAEIKTRVDNEYRDRSDKAPQYCFTCLNFIPPETTGGCGTCRTVKGPINPLGWCTAWTERRG